MTSNRTEVALIAPPFSVSNSPYISLPVLMGWLKQEGIPTCFVDLANDLEEAILTPDRIRQAYASITETFVALNEQAELLPSKAFRAAELEMLLKRLAPFYRDWEKDDFRRANRTLLTELVAAPHWPYCLRADEGLQIRSRNSIYSSHDLICEGEASYFFTTCLKELILRKLNGEKTLVAGIAIVFDQQVIPAMQCARIIKECFPQIHVTLGGPFVTIHLRHLQNRHFFKYVDSLILDEGELPLVALTRALRQGTPHLADVPNLVWCDATGAVRHNQCLAFTDTGSIPVPDYSGCALDRYPDSKNMRLTVRLSKGCYWRRCNFCRVTLSLCRNYSQPDAATVYRSLCEVIDSTGVTNFLFSDESCAPEILETISEKLCADRRNIAWTFHTRIDRKRLTRERVEKFKAAGCTGFAVGIETFNDRLLQLLNKGTTEKEITLVLRDLKGTVPITGYMMVGLPTETEEEYRRSFQAIEQFRENGLLDAYQYSLFCLTSGSLMWQRPERYGIRKIDGLNGMDLMPNNITCFASDGMSRLQAFKQYVTWMSTKFPPQIAEMPISIEDDKHFSRYHTRNLIEAMGEQFIKQLDTPFVAWLDQSDAKCASIKGQDPWWMCFA